MSALCLSQTIDVSESEKRPGAEISPFRTCERAPVFTENGPDMVQPLMQLHLGLITFSD